MTFSCLGFWYFPDLASNMDFIHDYWDALHPRLYSSEPHMLDFGRRHDPI